MPGAWQRNGLGIGTARRYPRRHAPVVARLFFGSAQPALAASP